MSYYLSTLKISINLDILGSNFEDETQENVLIYSDCYETEN